MHVRSIIASALATAIALAAGVSAAPQASAEEVPAQIVVVSPADGGTLPSRSRGPVVLELPQDSDVMVSVECGEYDYSWTEWIQGSGRMSLPIDPLEGFGGEDLSGKTCTLEVYSFNYMFESVNTSFRVQAPSLVLGQMKATAPVFYPIVRDGYLDKTQFAFHSNRSADAVLSIKNSSGVEVYRGKKRLSGGSKQHRWDWHGTSTGGSRVKQGVYRATLTVSAAGRTVSRTSTVTVATKKIIQKKTIAKDGLSSRDSTKGNCYITFSTYDESTTLDCWGGNFAATTFTFKVPRNAKILRWSAETYRASSDRCCNGSITTRGKRVSKTKYQIRVQVTGWRAADVYGARLTYKARVQI